MKAKAVPISDLIKMGKWRADLHVHADSKIKSERFKLVPLSKIVIESKMAKHPRDMEPKEFLYVGLEHVQQITGEPQGISIVTSGQIRSRSKMFEKGDILYGRLRPNLRKAFYVEPPYTNGLCSTEFIVLKAKSEFILPLFLREILVSDTVTKLVTRMQAGAALPRISSKDLLSIRIPLPSLEYQEECVFKIDRFRKQRRELLSKVNALSKERQKIISEVLT
jgi:restriction endonuclease S subunit